MQDSSSRSNYLCQFGGSRDESRSPVASNVQFQYGMNEALWPRFISDHTFRPTTTHQGIRYLTSPLCWGHMPYCGAPWVGTHTSATDVLCALCAGSRPKKDCLAFACERGKGAVFNHSISSQTTHPSTIWGGGATQKSLRHIAREEEEGAILPSHTWKSAQCYLWVVVASHKHSRLGLDV
eukprot:228041-Amphidinium_carterae.1